MKDVAIAIRIGSKNSSITLVKNTFESIKNNIGICDWKIFISLGVNIDSKVKNFVIQYCFDNNQNFYVFQEGEYNWSEFINSAIDITHEYEFFIKSHDDIELITPNFFNLFKNEYNNFKNEVGWISFTDVGWKRGDFSPSVRSGYFKDVREQKSWERNKIFQFHVFPDNWTRSNYLFHIIHFISIVLNKYFKTKILNYPKPINKISKLQPDMPKRSVLAHAPFNHFVIIKRDTLLKIGYCENWGTLNALLVDEDWGLRALYNNIPNIWIPFLEYFHYRGTEYQGGGTRSWGHIKKDIKRVDNLFYEKWGFHSEPSNDELKSIQVNYKKTLIPWTITKYSYEWVYINN